MLPINLLLIMNNIEKDKEIGSHDTSLQTTLQHDDVIN